MRFSDWAKRLPDLSALKPAFESLNASSTWQSVADEARAVLLAAQFLRAPSKVLVLTSTYEKCLKWQAKLVLAGIAESQIKQLPSGTSALFEDAAPEHIALSERLGAVRALADDDPVIVIATAPSALERTLPADLLQDLHLELRPGGEMDPDKLVSRLKRLGYEHQEPVRLPGQYSKRGGIVDVYATGQDLPVRVEFFGDEVESLRSFDPTTQRSVGQLKGISLNPSRETVFPDDVADFRDMLIRSMDVESGQLEETSAERLRSLIAEDADSIVHRRYFDRLDLYRPLIFPDSGCAVDLLGSGGLLLLDEPLELEGLITKSEEDLAQALKARAERGEILHSTVLDFMLPPEHISNHDRIWNVTAMNAIPSWLEAGKEFDLEIASLEPCRARPDSFAKTLKTWGDQKLSVVFCTDQPSRATSMLNQVEIFVGDSIPEDKIKPGYYLSTGNLAGGFALQSEKLVFVTDAELFGVGRLKLPQKRFLEGAPIATVLDLKPGDYVVHIQYGIGVYQGLVKRIVDGQEKEYLYIEYSPPDKLYVPADQLDRVQKYLNPGDAAPKIYRLTGGEWQKTISKAREDAKAFAQDLVKLYAERKTVQRPSFGPDTPWQSEMEATFPWVETPSQLGAIRDVKRDLTTDYPMDRLVCGDVGFGKTEVAIRAAFKVVQAGRQVAVLCPTTILSEQHYRNFLERMGPFGVRLALLNRFTHANDRRQILSDLERGKVDLIIGTHAILSAEVAFKDLGMVVIDEEQKFGVKQKEVLKKLRTAVDVLSMSATPIPRTLSMALMDIRQMSLINDPPPGRLPVRTFVRPYASEVVREALLRELSRGGQVFYVYNRVNGIFHIAEKLRKIVPNASIAVAHGQMGEKEIEPVMIGFIKGEIDILLSTTIVENGIDIANVNTLIVENADRFGLSQLYQLRGRVGRSDRQAYAYLLYESNKVVADIAMQRLQALQEFSTLGSGYSLAFRDLQIRGAGELLGAKQHGAMASVGYELYSQLISEQVSLMKALSEGEISKQKLQELEGDSLSAAEPLPSLDLPISALIPESYIKDQAQRLYIYQRMMSVRDLDALGETRAEIVDRYGHLPEEVANALAVMHVRVRAHSLWIDKMEARGGRVAVWFRHREKIPAMAFSIMGKKNRESYLTRENLIWPYTGDPLAAAQRLVETLENAIEEVRLARIEA
ncbi:MAG: transcription-repair coupling factor [Fimbriimonadaceae bacterium]|nr:transcription-repair coupling factor [Fimbriimonadaceae bacterium]